MRWFRGSRIAFPPVESADEQGLLMLGGEISAAWMLEGYRRGVFLWPICFDGKEITAWFAPNPRGILELDDFHVSRSFRRRLNRRDYEVRCDTAFGQVVEACSQPRHSRDGTWITAPLQRAYLALHALGHAHSVEIWREGRLIGGVFGVAVQGLFAAESMFHRETDASKLALYHLVEHLRSGGFALLDIQVWSPHTGRLGAIEIPRAQYQRRLSAALQLSAMF
jgi:leucyl/phenylalanyl-tRNA---protein transferase